MLFIIMVCLIVGLATRNVCDHPKGDPRARRAARPAAKKPKPDWKRDARRRYDKYTGGRRYGARPPYGHSERKNKEKYWEHGKNKASVVIDKILIDAINWR
jgi:hypothetical protein